VFLELISIRKAADQLGISLASLYEAARTSERLRAVRCGKQIWLLKEDVDNYEPRAYPRREEEEEAKAASKSLGEMQG